MTEQRQKRVSIEIKKLRNELPTIHGVRSVCFRGLDIVYALMTGLEGSPFAGGEYVCEITLPPNYPSDPPKIKYITPNGRHTFVYKRRILQRSGKPGFVRLQADSLDHVSYRQCEG